MDRFSGCAPAYICQLLQKGCAGTVEMVNSRGIYLQLGDRHVLLCPGVYGTVPNGIALDGWERLPAMLATGQPVRVEAGKIFFPSGAWELQLRSVPRDTQLRFPEEKGLRAGTEVLLANTKPTGLSCLAYPLLAGQMPQMNPFCRVALPHAQALLQALPEENAAAIREAVGCLLGLGPGLTPSGDDLLSGLMYGLRHSGARDTAVCAALTQAIRELAGTRTNAVSADYLLAMADDAPFALMAAAWEDPAAGAEGLLHIGSNAGSEMLLGLLCAATVVPVLVKKYGKEKHSDLACDQT